ncbi:uncharacterized protein DS421_14g462970 [Arachis hypogaea]|nr:uncharacterized protein DS421_14g462970 [Arachis hypogaea]
MMEKENRNRKEDEGESEAQHPRCTMSEGEEEERRKEAAPARWASSLPSRRRHRPYEWPSALLPPLCDKRMFAEGSVGERERLSVGLSPSSSLRTSSPPPL